MTLIFAHNLDKHILKLNSYDVKGNRDEHVKHFGDCLDYYHADDTPNCNLFALTMT